MDMDRFWEMVSQRVEDLSVVKQRLVNQWNIILNILQNDIPRDLREYMRLYSLMTQERLQRANTKALNNIKAEWTFVKRNTTRITDICLQFLQHRWQQLQPRLDNLVQTSFAISTATSTLQLSVQITPIVLSAMTILATAPMLNALLPDFLFNSTVLFFIMVGISSYAGYSKFKELETRAKLDGQITINHHQNRQHNKQLKQLVKRLQCLEQSLATALQNNTAITKKAALVPAQQRNTRSLRQLTLRQKENISLYQQHNTRSLRQSTLVQKENVSFYRNILQHKR